MVTRFTMIKRLTLVFILILLDDNVRQVNGHTFFVKSGLNLIRRHPGPQPSFVLFITLPFCIFRILLVPITGPPLLFVKSMF